jgi:hypothetical protein
MDFFGADPNLIDKTQIWSQDDPDWFPPSDRKLPVPLKIIVATVPDPVAPALREQFDDSITAIQRAAEEAGYVLDRLDLPWPAPNTARAPSLESRDELEIRWRPESSAPGTTSGAPPVGVKESRNARTTHAQTGRGTTTASSPYFVASRSNALEANRFESARA